MCVLVSSDQDPAGVASFSLLFGWLYRRPWCCTLLLHRLHRPLRLHPLLHRRLRLPRLLRPHRLLLRLLRLLRLQLLPLLPDGLELPAPPGGRCRLLLGDARVANCMGSATSPCRGAHHRPACHMAAESC